MALLTEWHPNLIYQGLEAISDVHRAMLLHYLAYKCARPKKEPSSSIWKGKFAYESQAAYLNDIRAALQRVRDKFKSMGINHSFDLSFGDPECDLTIPPTRKRIVDRKKGVFDKYIHRAAEENIDSPGELRVLNQER